MSLKPILPTLTSLPARALLAKHGYFEAVESGMHLLRKKSELPRHIRPFVGYKDPIVDPFASPAPSPSVDPLLGALPPVSPPPVVAYGPRSLDTRRGDLPVQGAMGRPAQAVVLV